MKNVYLAASVRTPIGRFGGTLANWTAADLGVAADHPGRFQQELLHPGRARGPLLAPGRSGLDFPVPAPLPDIGTCGDARG